MTEPDDFTRPSTTPAPRRRRPSFAAPTDEIDVPPLDQIAPTLEPCWHKEDSDTPDRTASYHHPDGHRLGLRIQSRGLAIQTWITAGPDLPPIPDGTDIEQAEAQAANDARLQPGRTWHAVLATRHSKELAADLAALVRGHLLPALTRKPKHVSTTTDEQKADTATEGPTT
ncbi:hypothetical protein [Streptomyces sp. 5-6(2022)]|uniref:hypothetical protein n=1 Tax=Streptomyces sp. 5-6(2022) TaxID=2936510 RepID=UPI0023BA1683|nr:hypothetical protein [Streptomyces sp. 5-6(2022)]